MSRIFVTGAAQGIGLETARTLIDMGHDVVAHARTAERAAVTRAAIPGVAAIVTGELSDMASTKDLAAQAMAAGPYDVIVHNAAVGGGSGGRAETADGLERIFHVNVVGPFILTCLMPLAPRMVYLTSGLEADGRLHMDDLQWLKRPWHGMQAYSDTKLHDSILSFELAARRPEIVVNAVDPGWIRTGLGGPNAPDPIHLGAETQVWLATSDEEIATTSGQYIKRREVHVPNPATQDATQRAALVAELERITGLTFP
jgi:NAD(P)-dependent dehydrogenase (short-subunit alcohol dehydrogenase family)